jgi:hypothetical protein
MRTQAWRPLPQLVLPADRSRAMQPAPTSRPSASAPATARDDDRRAAPQERDVANFERALRQRSRPRDQDRDGGQDEGAREPKELPRDAAAPAPLSPPMPFALALAQAQAQAQPAEAAQAARGQVKEPPLATQRAELALLAPASTPEAARAFEVSLNGPLGAGGVTLHAVAPAAGAGWTLAIGAHGLNPQDLRRNLGRLEERLRAKALSHEPVDVLDPLDPAGHADHSDHRQDRS